MGTRDGDRHFFPLTSLQIGDLQSYLSCLTLFLAPKSNKLFILVDNRPWLTDQDTRPAHLWQFMVTKYRRSPFANTRAQRNRRSSGKRLDFTNCSRSDSTERSRLDRWYALIDAALGQKKALLPVKKLNGSFLVNKELHHTLSGFIVFEVAWAHVRGINYVNELQTDTSMALEAKIMKRWEFDSIEQASSCISLWFSGTHHDRRLLEVYLDSISATRDVFYDADDNISVPDSSCQNVSNNDCSHEDEFLFKDSYFSHSTGEMRYALGSPYTPPVSGPYKRRKIMKSGSGSDDEVCEEAYSEIIMSPRISVSSMLSNDSEGASSVVEDTTFKDVLILFRFNDHDLPFKLKEIIMSDLRLLRLLEYGLPSWVIFLQSYPVFCKVYRPWMCPLARVLYVLISVTTVLIGFYDLYKNVPLLKATASRLFGPLFDWIETWEMVSRIKYLGTMLFLHNFEMAVKWFLMITRATKSLLSVLTRPIAGPIIELVEFILPFWNLCLEVTEWLSSIILVAVASSSTIIASILQIIVWPIWLVFSTIWGIATSVICPILWVLWEILAAPMRFVLSMASFMKTLLVNIYYLLQESWLSMSAMFRVTSAPGATLGTYEASIWRTLWNDLFSQVFRAIRSILYGFVAFFTTCNRHRLSIYNHIRDIVLRISHATHSSRQSESNQDTQSHRPSEDCEGSKTKRPQHAQERILRRRRSRRVTNWTDKM